MKVARPTLLLDEYRCKANIKKMAAKARKDHLVLRPHFKTHQSKVIGKWFKEEGVHAINVSSLGMAAYFAEEGWQEITVAFPVNILEADLINELAAKVQLHLLVDNIRSVQNLNDVLNHQVSMYVEIDTGGGRTGIVADDWAEVRKVANAVLDTDKLRLKGFYTHAGHSYSASSEQEISSIFDTVIQALNTLRARIGDSFGAVEFCMGDTPTCSVASHFKGIDAISPGNFVFYDVMQVAIGACNIDDVAVAMACPVVSKNNRTKEVCIYGGAVHFSKDAINVNGQDIYGRVVRLDEKGWSLPLEECYVSRLSQEHGIIKVSEKAFDQFNPGDVIGVLPIHSCLTAEAMGCFRALNGTFIDHYAQKNRD